MKISDLGLAVALIVSGHELLDMRKISPTKCEFEFDDFFNTRHDKDLYFKKELQVDAMKYFEEMRTLKSRLHALLN